MPRVAILGSCITRDLWPIRGEGADHLLYISRTSFPSLLSGPPAAFEPAPRPPGDLRRHEHAALVADITKTALTRLLAFRPTHVIVDFIDDRFDLLSVNGALIVRSGELSRSGYEKAGLLGAPRVIPRLSVACALTWRFAAAEFAALVKATVLGEADFILHSARWATDYRDRAGKLHSLPSAEILGGDPVEIAPYNELLRHQETVITGLLPGMAIVESDTFRVADEGHRWGLSPFHYVPEYYDDIRRQLGERGLSGVFSAPAAEPSLPGG